MTTKGNKEAWSVIMDDSYETSDPDSSIEVVVNQLFKRAPLKLDDEDNESTLYHRGGQRQSGTPMISEGSGEGSREGTSGDDTDVTDFTEVELGMSEDGGYRAGAVFKKARQLLNPSLFYRTIVYLFAERKMVVFFGIHLVSTLIIWAHFALIKFDSQRQTVPEGAPRYWWKVMTPTLEFGSMHAILFQMALLPITMSRFSIAALCDTVVGKLVPLNRTLRMHIHLGYTMILVVSFATVFFFTFFGLLCADGDQSFCDKFTSEIMITGYGIFGSLLIIGVTSYCRHMIPYEIFYAIHHLVFIMYFVTIAHTIDIEQRKGLSERSQTFKWFSSTLLFYFCDRAAMYINHRYTTRLAGSATVSGSNGSRMIILKMKQPVLFRFKPGQYAFLHISAIDNHWHPFSIASGPDSNVLEFYIEVCGDNSWTGKLWDLLVQHQHDHSTPQNTSLQLYIDVMGPYGTCLAKTEDYSHILALGAGTGIVPVLSLLKQHVRNMLHFDPTAYFQEQRRSERNMHNIKLAMEQKKGSFARKFLQLFRTNKKADDNGEQGHSSTRKELLRKSIRQSLSRHGSLVSSQDLRHNKAAMQKQAYLATRSLYGVVLLTIVPVLGISVLSFTISWNTINIDLFDGMIDSLQVFTWIFQSIFVILALFVWDATTLLSYTDAAISLVTPFADYYWYRQYYKSGVLSGTETTLLCLLILYMTFRVWIRAVQPRHNSWKSHFEQNNRTSTVDRLDFVWTTRSASQVSKILPDILYIWDALVKSWGYENARQVCRISFHVTDKDRSACDLLKSEMEGTGLDVTFSRLDIPQWIENHTLDMIDKGHSSYSLLAFCGSPELARDVHYHKISNDMVTAITGNKNNHQMEFISESYGGASKQVSTAATAGDKEDNDSQDDNDGGAEDAVTLSPQPHSTNTNNISTIDTRTNNKTTKKSLNTRIQTSYFNPDDRRRFSFSGTSTLNFFSHLNKSSSRLVGKESVV